MTRCQVLDCRQLSHIGAGFGEDGLDAQGCEAIYLDQNRGGYFSAFASLPAVASRVEQADRSKYVQQDCMNLLRWTLSLGRVLGTASHHGPLPG